MGTAQASDYLENALIDHLFRSRTFAKPAALWMGLYTSPPTDAGGGSEVVGGAYARVNLPPLDTNWASTQGTTTAGNSTGTTGLTSNAVGIVFALPSGSWGSVTHFGIFDAATGGNLLIWDALTTPRTIAAGDPAPTFGVGALTVTIA